MAEENVEVNEDGEKKNGPTASDATAACGVESMEDKEAGNKSDGEKCEIKGEDINKKEEKSENKKKYANWPLKDVKETHDNDVLYGRGGGTNHHPGNKLYRKMVEDRKLDYVNSKRLDKPLVALEIIKFWRSQEPPGRFLKLDEKSGLWQDVGDKKAREKTSQALRERAPEIRRKQEEEEMVKSGKDPNANKKSSTEKNKSIRFDKKTKEQRERAPLHRAHTLGEEYLTPGEKVSLDGFTWDPSQFDQSAYPPGGNASTAHYPAGRHTSYGSQGAMPPQFPPSRDGSRVVPPSSVDLYPNIPPEERQQSFGSTSSWARIPSNGAPPPPPYGGSPYQMRSGSFGNMSRDHSLSYNPLRDASLSAPANQLAFERGGSGYWSSNGNPSNLPPPPQQGMPPVYSNSSGSSRYMSGPNRGDEPPIPKSQQAAPYSLDPDLAKNWSAQPQDYEKVAGMFEEGMSKSWSTGIAMDNQTSNIRESDPVLPRPDIVKRMTSNQNEDLETKPDLQPGRSVKRAALNRDNSMASNRLKEQYPPTSTSGSLKKPVVLDSEMRSLSISTEQISLDAMNAIDHSTSTSTVKPNPLSQGERTSTIDKIAMDLLAADPSLAEAALNGESTSSENLCRPPAIRTEGRMRTAEYLDLINEPLGQDDDGMNRAEWLQP